MAFDEVRLPEDVERGAQGGPMFKTTVLSLSSGFEKRNIDWSEQRCSYDVGYGIETKEHFTEVIKFFYARRGKARGFRFKDWSDFEMPRQAIGTGDASNPDFQIYKRYTSGSVDYDRILRKIVDGTVSVWSNNVLISPSNYDIDMDTGLITFHVGSIPGVGHIVEVECEFDVPVRFDTDQLEINVQTFEAGSIPQIPIVELKIASA